MTSFQAFQALNPDVHLLTLSDPSFADFGIRYEDYDLTQIERVMADVIPPEEGTAYLPSLPQLEATETIQAIGRDVYAGMPIEAGVTQGHARTFTAFEYHQCSETNIMLDDVVMVLAQRRVLEAKGKIDPNRDAALFYVPKGSVIELYNSTLHYTPLSVSTKAYQVLVIAVKGTNEPLPAGFSSQNPRVVKQGKFQVVHPSRKDKIAQGYQVGLSGKVLTVNPVSE